MFTYNVEGKKYTKIIKDTGIKLDAWIVKLKPL